jgi:hypothetical protein
MQRTRAPNTAMSTLGVDALRSTRFEIEQSESTLPLTCAVGATTQGAHAAAT